MRGIQGLVDTIQQAVQKKVADEARALKGVMKDGRFVNGAKSYPAIQAVDVDTSDGNTCWAQLDRNGNAVIVGS